MVWCGVVLQPISTKVKLIVQNASGTQALTLRGVIEPHKKKAPQHKEQGSSTQDNMLGVIVDLKYKSPLMNSVPWVQ